jgi:hypothetical protein
MAGYYLSSSYGYMNQLMGRKIEEAPGAFLGSSNNTELLHLHSYIVKGSGRGGQHQQQPPALGEEGDFAVHASVYGKVQAKDSVNPNHQERKGKKEELVLARAGLSSYLCRLCTICQSVRAKGWYPPHHNIWYPKLAASELWDKISQDYAFFSFLLLACRCIERLIDPRNATNRQVKTTPKVNGNAIAQKCFTVLVVPVIPSRFMPRNPVTKLSGRKRMVTTVKTIIALLLSSSCISTSFTFKREALSRSSAQSIMFS